jgi:4-hydroxybenzoate polyprenyltransferase
MIPEIKTRQRLIIKIISLLSILRWYNILLVSLSLLLASLFLLNDIQDYRKILTDYHLYTNITAIAFLMMAGFIINAFYDFEKDIINKPEETIFGRIVSKSFCLNAYVIFILIGLSFSFLSGWKVLIFNFLFSFCLWFYSQKLRKKAFAGEINASLLTIAPFFSMSLLYQEYNLMTFLFVGYIFAMTLTREVVKKMIGLKGDLIVGEKSLPIVIGIKNTKYVILILMFTALGCISFLIQSIMYLPIAVYFCIAAILIIVSIFLLNKSKQTKDYEKLNLIYKLLLIFGILCIPLVGKWW